MLVTLLLSATRALLSDVIDASLLTQLGSWTFLVCNSLAVVLGLASSLAAWNTEPRRSAVKHLFSSQLLWFGASLTCWCAWPQGPDFAAQPLWIWLQIAVTLSIPLNLFNYLPSPKPQMPSRFLWVVCSVSCGISLLATGVHLWAMRASIGGVDFFFYVVNARDMLEVPDEITSVSYQYFPGVFQFWRIAYRLSHGELAGLQWSYLAVLITNAALIGGILWSLTKRLELATLGAVWYVVLLSRFEGFYGVTEPIATLPLLAGLLAWQGKPLVTASGWWRVVLLGIAIGISVVTKQQAGLLSIAAASLLLQQWLGKTPRHQWRWLFALPAIAGVTFLGLILLEGRGFEPLRAGLEMVSTYESQEALLQNAWKLIRNDESLALFAGIALLTWLAVLGIQTLRRTYGDSDWFAVTSFCLLATLLSLVQLRTRGYYHYALLGAPFLVISCLLLTAKLAIPKLRDSQASAVTWLGCGCLLTFPLFYTGGNPQSLSIWRLNLNSIPAPELWHESPEITAALPQLKQTIAPGERILLFPPRYNAVHFLLGSRSANPRGYGFLGTKTETIDWSTITHVIMVDEADPDPNHRQARERWQRELASAPWHATLETAPFTVYSR